MSDSHQFQRRRDATANRAALIRAAQSVLAANPRASLSAIARAAGLSRRALYDHFPHREALLQEVLAIAQDQYVSIAQDTDVSDPRMALSYMVNRLWSAASAVRAWAAVAETKGDSSQSLQALTPLRSKLLSVIEVGSETDVFRTDMQPELLAFLVEEAVRAALRELDPDHPTGAAVLVRLALSIVGVPWTEQGAIIEAQSPLVPGN